jgi:hypothetical protein
VNNASGENRASPRYSEMLDVRKLAEAPLVDGSRLAGAAPAAPQPVSQASQFVLPPGYVPTHTPTERRHHVVALAMAAARSAADPSRDPAQHHIEALEGLRAARSLAALGHPEAQAFIASLHPRLR